MFGGYLMPEKTRVDEEGNETLPRESRRAEGLGS
jgi:hypothetical protein